MNKRAERFKKFIADQKVEGFTIEEPKSEPNNLVLFRSNFRMDGNLLPFGIFVDDTPFAMIRVVVVAEARAVVVTSAPLSIPVALRMEGFTMRI